MRGLSPSALSAVAGVTALVGSFKALTSSVKGALDNFAHFESMQKGLETFFQSAEKGKTKFEELRKLSNETTFGVDELADSFTQLANVGVNVDTINDKLVMLGNISGGNKQKFADLVSVYSKIMSTGKAGSMQIQQLAMRGVPIYDMLKKIGVQGVATGEDITKAFQEMTKEGGQFYNAMNNINDTIEGKEGFISDYFKELTVNFVEVTGIADSYKQILDILKETIGNISDWLLKINENPVAKAFLKGTIVTIVTALVGVIVSALIPALTTVVGLLGAINPAGILIGLGVGAFAGVVSGVKSMTDAQKELKEATEKANEQLEIQKLKSPSKQYQTQNTRYDNLKKEVEDYKAIKAEITKNLETVKKELNEKVNNYNNVNWQWASSEQIRKAKEQFEIQKKDLEDKIAYYEKTSAKVEEQITSKSGILQVYDNADANSKKFAELTDFMNELYATTDKGKSNIAELNEQLQKLQELKDLEGKDGTMFQLIKFDDKTKKEIDYTVDYLKKKLIEQKINLGEIISWKDAFSYATGVNVTTNGAEAGKEYYQKMVDEYNKSLATIEKLEKLTGKDYKDQKKDLAKSVRDKIESTISQLFNFANLDDTFKETDGSIQEMSKALQLFNTLAEDTADKIPTLADKFNKWITEMIESKGLGKTIGGMALSSVTSASSDFSAFMQGTEQSKNIWGGVINTLISAITNVCREFENFEKVMNPITDSMRQLKPVLRFIFNLLERLVNVSETFFAGIGALFESLEPILEVIIGLIEVMATPLSVIGALLKILSPLIKALAQIIAVVIKIFTFGLIDAVQALNNALYEATTIKEEENKQERDLTSGYKALLDAMQNNEEWYLKEKTALNANTRKNAYSVNDMILTPQGNFSTDPNDYIIATKNPSELGNSNNSGAVFNMIVNNEVSNVEVNAQQTDNGMGGKDIIVTISQQIANDVANGANGWDSALNQREVRLAGRRIAL